MTSLSVGGVWIVLQIFIVLWMYLFQTTHTYTCKQTGEEYIMSTKSQNFSNSQDYWECNDVFYFYREWKRAKYCGHWLLCMMQWWHCPSPQTRDPGEDEYQSETTFYNFPWTEVPVTFHKCWWLITKEGTKLCWEWTLKKSMCVLISFIIYTEC